MSDLSRLEIAYVCGCEPIDVDEHAKDILKMLAEFGYGPMTLNYLRDAFADGASAFGGRAHGLLSVTEQIAKLLPTVIFHARCTGEEFRDTWVREFKGGKAVFAVGPWGYDD